MVPMRPYYALLFCLLAGCAVSGDLEDPTPDPSTGDDDDATEAEPLEGEWEGTAAGAVVYGSAGQYPCDGWAEASIDADDRASGSLDCTFPHSGDECVFSFDGLRVGGGQRAVAFPDCFGDGDATYSMWAANGLVYGRVQRLGSQVSVELSWTLERAAAP